MAVFHDERIKRMLKGALRKYGTKPARVRLEITKEILHAMLSTFGPIHDDVNLRAAFCTAFAAFLRIGEFTWTQWSPDSSLRFLSRGSVQFVTDGVLLRLPASKTDPFRKGVTIPLSPSHDSTCPVAALRLLFQRYPKPLSEPLFSRSYGPFNRDWVLQRVSQVLLLAGFNPRGFSGHSFRRGAANSAQKAGISRADIMRMGRWKSDAVERYFSESSNNSLLFSLSRQLHQPGPSISVMSSSTSTPRARHRA